MASQLTAPARSRMFLMGDGRSVALTFVLVNSLFLLWGFCNGLIDVMVAVPMFCFALVAIYGFCWPRLSNSQSLHGRAKEMR